MSLTPSRFQTPCSLDAKRFPHEASSLICLFIEVHSKFSYMSKCLVIVH
jgi:hypothetical protein